jgi:hypothetical protein
VAVFAALACSITWLPNDSVAGVSVVCTKAVALDKRDSARIPLEGRRLIFVRIAFLVTDSCAIAGQKPANRSRSGRRRKRSLPLTPAGAQGLPGKHPFVSSTKREPSVRTSASYGVRSIRRFGSSTHRSGAAILSATPPRWAPNYSVQRRRDREKIPPNSYKATTNYKSGNVF